MESWRSVILLFAGAQGLFFSTALILSSLKRQQANIFLGLILAVCSLELLNAWSMPFNYHNRENAFPFWILGSYLILPSAVWLFMKTNIDPTFKISRGHLYLFIPAWIEIITEFIVFYIHRFTGKRFPLWNYAAWFVFTEILPVLLMVFVLIQYWVQVQRLQGDRFVGWLKQYGFFLVFSCITVLWIAESIFLLQIYFITEFLLVVFLFVLGYIVYFQPVFFQITPKYKGKQTAETFPQYQEEYELQRLKILFEENKIYRKPRLTLEDLSGELNLPVRFVSFLINKYQNTNFNSFVNTYRVKEVLEKMKDPKEQHKTLLAIALDSGFNSKSSFNHIFKTYTGQTPSKYLSKIKK